MRADPAAFAAQSLCNIALDQKAVAQGKAWLPNELHIREE